MYRAVIFDLDSTLLDFYACETHALKEAFQNAGLHTEPAATWEKVWSTYAPISAHYWNRREEDGLSRDQVVEYTISDTLSALGIATALARSIAEEYWSVFCTTAYLNAGARQVLERLQGHYLLGVVTNGYGQAQRGRLHAAGLEGYFSTVVISDEVGYAKPSRRIFEIALAEVGVTHREALYVGDSIEHDCYGAMNAGIDFCHYRSAGARSEGEPAPKLEIRHLQDLERILIDDHRDR